MRPLPTALALTAAWCITVLPTGTARAAGELPPPRPEPVWEAGIAGGMASTSTYAGSSRRDIYAALFPYLVYRGPWLRVSGSAAKLMLVEEPRYWIDVSGGGWVPVNQSDESARAGMPDLDLTVQAGPRVNLLAYADRRWSLLLRLAVRAVWSAAALTDVSHRGYVAEPGVRATYRPRGPGGRLSLSTTLSLLLGDSEHNGYFYDVPPAYATPSRPAFSSGGGLVSYGLTQSVGWRVTRRIRVGLFGQVEWLDGTVVSDSPLVRQHRAMAVGAGFSWSFWQSERTVALPSEATD